MVSTHLKNMRQIGPFPQFSGWKFQKYLSCHHPQFSSSGCFLRWWYPQNTSKWSFLVGKPMVVGYHHFRKPPSHLYSIFSSSAKSSSPLPPWLLAAPHGCSCVAPHRPPRWLCSTLAGAKGWRLRKAYEYLQHRCCIYIIIIIISK